jgi:threonine/homoserine/homoserine lactone efflux protein
MSLSAFLAFAGIYALAVLMPGPGVTAVIAKALTTGARRTLPFVCGMALGDLVWFSFAAFGLAALAQMLHGLFIAVKYAGAAYLLFLAWKLWSSSPAAPHGSEGRPGGSGTKLVLAGLSLTLGNPKPMVFFLAVLPHVLDLARLDAASFLELAGTMAVIHFVGVSAYALLAGRARLMIRDPRRMKAVNRGSALVMAGAAAIVAAD